MTSISSRTRVLLISAGLLAAAVSLFSFSYSVWNEAFWATLALSVAGLVLLSRRERSSLA